MGFEMTIWPYVFIHSFYVVSALLFITLPKVHHLTTTYVYCFLISYNIHAIKCTNHNYTVPSLFRCASTHGAITQMKLHCRKCTHNCACACVQHTLTRMHMGTSPSGSHECCHKQERGQPQYDQLQKHCFLVDCGKNKVSFPMCCRDLVTAFLALESPSLLLNYVALPLNLNLLFSSKKCCKSQAERKCLQITYPIKSLYPKET